MTYINCCIGAYLLLYYRNHKNGSCERSKQTQACDLNFCRPAASDEPKGDAATRKTSNEDGVDSTYDALGGWFLCPPYDGRL